MIGQTLHQHELDDFLVTFHALHLVERAFVVIQLKPRHPVQYGLHRFRRGALHIGIFDAQNESATMFAGIGPRE